MVTTRYHSGSVWSPCGAYRAFTTTGEPPRVPRSIGLTVCLCSVAEVGPRERPQMSSTMVAGPAPSTYGEEAPPAAPAPAVGPDAAPLGQLQGPPPPYCPQEFLPRDHYYPGPPPEYCQHALCTLQHGITGRPSVGFTGASVGPPRSKCCRRM